MLVDEMIKMMSAGKTLIWFPELSSTNIRSTSKLHPNYEQTTSKLLKCTSKLLKKYIHATSNVHPNYEEGEQKTEIFNVWGLISFN